MRRGRSILAVLLLLGSGPYQFSWAFAVAVLADHGHHLSLHGSGDHVRVVLHHHELDGPAGRTPGPVFDARDSANGDHVLQIAQQPTTARRPVQVEVPAAPVHFEDVFAASAVASLGVPARVRVRSAVGPAPPGRTVVLRN